MSKNVTRDWLIVELIFIMPDATTGATDNIVNESVNLVIEIGIKSFGIWQFR